jgi:acetylornithine deacetylase/succinyl-diaminopimelate desuccinylase-like protein
MRVHANNERIDLENLRFGTKALVALLKEVAA